MNKAKATAGSNGAVIGNLAGWGVGEDEATSGEPRSLPGRLKSTGARKQGRREDPEGDGGDGGDGGDKVGVIDDDGDVIAIACITGRHGA